MRPIGRGEGDGIGTARAKSDIYDCFVYFFVKDVYPWNVKAQYSTNVLSNRFYRATLC